MTPQMTDASRYISEDFEAYTGMERSEMTQYIPAGAKEIIDVGCAVGAFGRTLKHNAAVHVTGIEINEHAASEARLYLDHVICGAFEEGLNLAPQSFDCIVFNDVLEHMVDPFEALLYAKKLLADKGVVVASIPNVRYFNNVWNMLVHKDWKYEQFGILDRTHLRFFTQKSIVETFESLGYQIGTLEGINPLRENHPSLNKQFKLLNTAFFNNLEDMAYQQFAVVAYPKP
jgi:2-polyprenyl-3-methyl-5-hydroxy-6-metoxy-1,4-benzoquinol methylase